MDTQQSTARVTVYSAPGCGQCIATVRALDANGIGYDVVDLTTDQAAHAYVTGELGYAQAPVVVAGEGDHWSGFRPDHIDRISREHAPRGFVARIVRGEYHAPGEEAVSTTFRRVLIAHPEGDVQTAALPVVQLHTRHLAGAVVHHFTPAAPCPPDRVGYMAGGAYIDLTPAVAAELDIPAAAYSLHDRTENRAQYAALSND